MPIARHLFRAKGLGPKALLQTIAHGKPVQVTMIAQWQELGLRSTLRMVSGDAWDEYTNACSQVLCILAVAHRQGRDVVSDSLLLTALALCLRVVEDDECRLDVGRVLEPRRDDAL